MTKNGDVVADTDVFLMPGCVPVSVTHKGDCVRLCFSHSNGSSILIPDPDLSDVGWDLPLQASLWTLWWPALKFLLVLWVPLPQY